MKYFFDPETVALIGASGTPLRPGNSLFQNLDFCFGDKFFPVNPKTEKIGERTCYPSILDAPGKVDVAIIFIPAKFAPLALEQCAQKGIKRVIIESGGFAEVGQEGAALTERCRSMAREAGIRLWGPNCMGSINVPANKVLSFLMPMAWRGRFKPGKVSLVVQSGMLSAGFLLQILSRTPFGLAKIASIGNKIDVDETDLLEYLLDDPDTGVIAMYVESLERGRRFFELARAAKKPIVALKGGRTSFGAKAASSHTAAMAQDDAVLDAAFRQAGVVRAKGMNELMDVARCLGVNETSPRPRARVAVITFSGGAGVVASDDVSDWGLELARFSEDTLSRIKRVYPDWMDPDNPADLYPAIEKNGPKRAFGATLAAVMEDPGVDAVYAHLFAPMADLPLYDYDKMAELVKRHKKPLVVWILGFASSGDKMRAELEKRGIAVVDDIADGVRILAAISTRSPARRA